MSEEKKIDESISSDVDGGIPIVVEASSNYLRNYDKEIEYLHMRVQQACDFFIGMPDYVTIINKLEERIKVLEEKNDAVVE